MRQKWQGLQSGVNRGCWGVVSRDCGWCRGRKDSGQHMCVVVNDPEILFLMHHSLRVIDGATRAPQNPYISTRTPNILGIDCIWRSGLESGN